MKVSWPRLPCYYLSTKLYSAICIFLLPELSPLLNENLHIGNTNSLSGSRLLLPWVYMPGTDPPATRFHFYSALRNILCFPSYLPSFNPNLLFSVKLYFPIQTISNFRKKGRNHTDSGLFYTAFSPAFSRICSSYIFQQSVHTCF